MANRICPCGVSTPKGQRCPCQQARAKQADKERGNSSQRGYDAEWSKVRFRHLHHHPTCVACGAPGKHVDHIVSVRDAPHRRLDPTNLRTLCHSCHSRRTAREQSPGWGR